VDGVVQAAREALSGSIHTGFVFTLCALGFAIVAALAMKNVRLDESAAGSRAPAPAARVDENREELLAGIALAYLARRVDSANGDSPNLVRTVSELVSPNGDASEYTRALRANEEVLKPLSRTLLTGYLRRRDEEIATREGVSP
jgi:hypothetical protein